MPSCPSWGETGSNMKSSRGGVPQPAAPCRGAKWGGGEVESNNNNGEGRCHHEPEKKSAGRRGALPSQRRCSIPEKGVPPDPASNISKKAWGGTQGKKISGGSGGLRAKNGVRTSGSH